MKKKLQIRSLLLIFKIIAHRKLEYLFILRNQRLKVKEINI